MAKQRYLVICFLILQIVGVVFCNAWMDTSLDLILEHLGIDRASVSEHQLVKLHSPRRLHKRDLHHRTNIDFEAFGDKYKISLYAQESFLVSRETQVCFARYAPGHVNDVQCRMVGNALEGVGTPMVDLENHASIMVGHDNSGRRTVNGHFRSKRDNARLVIKSLSEDIVGRYLRKRRSAIDDLDGHSINSTNHIVLKLNDDYLQTGHVSGVRSRRDYDVQYDRNSNYAKDNKPDTVYPSILVHVHHSISGNQPIRRKKILLEYILTNLNAVGLIYDSLRNPKVRLHIGIIMIAEDARATPYIFRNMLKENDTHYDGDSALADASSFYYSLSDLFPFDVAITMTKLSLLYHDHHDIRSRVMKPAGGLAYVGTACSRYHEAALHMGVTLAHDDGLYSGIKTVAHELGHLLGAHHEMEGPHSKCSIQRGLLMDDEPKMSKNLTRISLCTQYDIKENFKARKLECMYDKPLMMGKLLPNAMAGKPLDRNRLCEAEGLGPSCDGDEILPEHFCTSLYCRPLDGGNSCIALIYVMPAGTPCFTVRGNLPGICLNYECIPI